MSSFIADHSDGTYIDCTGEMDESSRLSSGSSAWEAKGEDVPSAVEVCVCVSVCVCVCVYMSG